MRSLLLSSAVTLSISMSGCLRGERGEPGPLREPPRIESISPESGSANTVWTIRGAGFGDDPRVTFDGHVATVVWTTSGALRVTDAFPPVSSMEIRAVSVESGKQVSNAHAVFAVPSGTLRESAEQHIWRHIDAFVALDGGVFYVVDDESGVFRFDQPTGEITRIAAASGLGISVQGLFRTGEEVLLVTIHEALNGQSTRISRVTAGGLEILLQDSGWNPIADLARSPAGELYYADGASVRRFTASGASDTFQSFGPAAGLAFVGGTLYVTDPLTDVVASVDLVTGDRTPFASELADPAALECGPEGLLVVDGTGIRRIDATGAVSPFYGGIPNALSVGPDDGRVYMFADWFSTNDTSIVEVSGDGALRIIASGLNMPVAMAKAGEWTVVSGFQELVDPGAGELFQGVTLALSQTEARVLSTEAYSLVSHAPVDEDRVLFGRFSNDGSRSELGFLDAKSGATQVIADETDGLGAPYTFVWEPQSGDVLVASYVVGDTAGSFARVRPDGTVEHGFARLPPHHYALSSALSGGMLWTVGIKGNDGPLFRVDVETGGELEPVAGNGHALGVLYDGLCADGRGGVYAADTLTGTVWHVDADGTFDAVAVLEPGSVVISLELDETTGDLLATVSDAAASTRLVSLVP